MTKVLPVFLLLFLLVACGQKEKQATTPVEDVAAKKMLQGIWLDEENGEPAFRVEGDTISILIPRAHLYISILFKTRLCLKVRGHFAIP